MCDLHGRLTVHTYMAEPVNECVISCVSCVICTRNYQLLVFECERFLVFKCGMKKFIDFSFTAV